MGGVPKWNKTKSRKNKRRMHIFAKAPSLVSCKKCGKPALPHTVCQNCGYYKGVEVINVLEKLTKKERKLKEKEMKEQEKTAKAELSAEELSKK